MRLSHKRFGEEKQRLLLHGRGGKGWLENAFRNDKLKRVEEGLVKARSRFGLFHQISNCLQVFYFRKICTIIFYLMAVLPGAQFGWWDPDPRMYLVPCDAWYLCVCNKCLLRIICIFCETFSIPRMRFICTKAIFPHNTEKVE